MKRNELLLAVVLSTAMGAAFAQVGSAAGSTGPARPDYTQLDANGDGKLARDEVANHPRLRDSFDRLDADQDGFLSQQELGHRHGHRRADKPRLDTDGDGVISRDEAKASPRLTAQFDQFDANKDGSLSADELRAAWQRHHAHRTKVDANADGQISREEAQSSSRLAQHFDAIDANKDGSLTRDEMRTWHRSQRPTATVKP